MFSTNKVILAGRVSSDVDFKQAKSMSIASFRMGVYAGKDKDGKASYNNFNVKAFKVFENSESEEFDTVYTNEVLADNVAIAL